MHIRIAIIGVLVFSVTGCTGSREVIAPEETRQAFHEDFGFDPQQNAAIRYHWLDQGDTSASWISFRYEDAVAKKIISDGYATALNEDQTNGLWRNDITTRNPNAPDWWPTIPLVNSEVYVKINGPSSYSYMWIDHKNNRVYVKFSDWQ